MLGQKIAQRQGSILSKNDLGIQVVAIDLAHEFAAHSAGWKHMDSAACLVAPDRHNLLKAILSGSNHRSQGTAFCT